MWFKVIGEPVQCPKCYGYMVPGQPDHDPCPSFMTPEILALISEGSLEGLSFDPPSDKLEE